MTTRDAHLTPVSAAEIAKVTSNWLRRLQSMASIERFKDLTERVLPSLATQQQWPIRFDHCFKRICLDNAFGDVWYRHLQRPAEHHLREPELSRAIAVAEQLSEEGRPALHALNKNSLQWRGKIAQ